MAVMKTVAKPFSMKLINKISLMLISMGITVIITGHAIPPVGKLAKVYVGGGSRSSPRPGANGRPYVAGASLP